VNFSGDTQYSGQGLHDTALLTFHDFVDCKVSVRSVMNYMAGAMRSLSARCGKESLAVPDGAAVVGTAVDGPDVTIAITHIHTHISLALTAEGSPNSTAQLPSPKPKAVSSPTWSGTPRKKLVLVHL